MWDIFRLSAVGNFYLRRIALLIVAGLMSALFVAITNSPTAFAEDASWNGDSISYEGNQYQKVTNPPALPNLDPSYGNIYSRQVGDKAYVIAVKDDDKSKPITDAQYRVYNFTNGVYSSSTDPPKQISIAATGGTGTQSGDDKKDENQTSCGVPSVGWMLCGISRFFAGAMDKAYEWVNNFLVVKPLSTDTSSGLYQAWNIARGFANLCFIVAFLVIIYSQITSVGISNYEIKKMIPRLVIAAILVNVSYYICTIGVDISNILGDSVQKALVEIRNSLPAPKSQIDWTGLTETILSGGTIAAGGLAAYVAVASSGGLLALVPLLVPVLVAGVLSILVALLVLAARQALITVLVIISPLAFVAFLLPNTEKMFNKWRELFMNMLMIFPFFSLLFGGSQLAAYLIIQNTDQIQVVILAMFVQVAPLAITPFLLRVSHSLLTKFGDMVNNPNKGLVDRSRNWAQGHSNRLRERQAARGATKPAWAPSRLAYNRQRTRINRDSAVKMYQEQVAAAVLSERRGQELIAGTKAAEVQKSAGQAIGERLYEQNKATGKNSDILQRDSGILRSEQDRIKTFQAIDEARWQEAQSAEIHAGMDHRYAAFAATAHQTHEQHLVAEQQKSAAETMQKKEFVEALRTRPQLQQMVGGIDPHGAAKAYSKAKAASYAAKAEVVKDIENGSDIMPGKTMEMVAEFERGIRENEVETVRAMINKLAASANPGVRALRDSLIRNEQALAAAGMTEEVKFHIDGHQSLNNDAEDLVSWSRQERSVVEVKDDPGTWSNVTAQKFIGQKQSSQEEALRTGGVSQATLREIMRNPAKVGMKPAVLNRIRQQLGIALDGSQDHTV